MLKRGVAVCVGAALVALSLPGTAAAHGPEPQKRIVGDGVVDTPIETHDHHDKQHGEDEGHLPGSSKNVRLLGQADIEGAAEGRVADVSAYGNYAYLTVRDPAGCSDAGVAVFDISNPRNPYQVEFIEASEGSYPGEGSQVVNIRTASFTGQILAYNNEICAEGGEGGVTLVDVTNPRKPVVLTQHAGDDQPGGAVSKFNQIHSAFIWQQGRKAYAVIVDNEESTDVDILDITDPRKPVLVSETNLNDFDVLQKEGTPLGGNSFLHDMVVKRIRGTWTMLLSYWDGGWVQLDVDNPAKPEFINDSDFKDPDALTGLSPGEGNAHQAEYSPNNQFIIGTSEDFSPYRLEPFLITGGPNAGRYEAGEFGFTVPISSARYGGEINGPTIYGGLGCPGGAALPPASSLTAGAGEEKIVVLLRGGCFFSEKVEAAQNAGYDAVIIANHHAGSDNGANPDATLCGSAGHEFTPTIAAVCIGHRAFHLLFGQAATYTTGDEPAVGTLGQKVSAKAQFDGWGYVHLLRQRNMQEIDAYAVEEALDPKYASGYGDLSVHEVAVDPRRQGLAYLSYYSAGLRVIKYGNRGITEVGHYIHENGNNFWGVEAHRVVGKKARNLSGKTLILASDRDSGLWIFQYTGK